MTGDNSGTIARYVEILCQEIEQTPLLGRGLQTVFFGGGTPSLLSVSQLERILQTLDQRFGIGREVELSMEMDPGTFDLTKIRGFQALGINRVSLGVQAFQAELLAGCGRSHTVLDVYEAVDLLHQADIPSISLDLISGLPYQTLEHWQESLTAAVKLFPNHLSTYDLTLEPGTPFDRQFKPGADPLPSDDTTAEMYRLAQQILTGAGYGHYEVSNYAHPGHQCRHNRVYWENRPFYGFGMGAASYLYGQRFTRPRKTREYYDWVAAGGLGTLEPPPSGEAGTQDRLLDTVMLGLRLAEGIDRTLWVQQFGQETLDRLLTRLEPFQQKGWVEIEPHRIRLTDPEGFLFSNVVLVDLFDALGGGA